MATDVNAILNSLTSFHDFKDKCVIAVGAGGGQLALVGQVAKQVIAIDQDAGPFDGSRRFSPV